MNNIDKHLDAVLQAYWSALRHFSVDEAREDMRKAMADAMREAAEEEREACARLCDEMVMAVDGGGNEYYRPAPADLFTAFQPKTELGKTLLKLRREYILSGGATLDDETFDEQIKR